MFCVLLRTRDLSGGAGGGVTGGRGCVVTETAPCIEVSICMGAVTVFVCNFDAVATGVLLIQACSTCGRI